MKLTEKFKAMTKQEKTMIIIVILLFICVLTRWDYIKTEAGEAFRVRIERTLGKSPEQTGVQESASLPADTSNNSTEQKTN